MIDFYLQTRLKMIDTMQSVLKPLRQILGLGVQDFGEIIGLTRQSINNLETRKSKMSATQYVAICALIDNIIEDKPELFPTISSLLVSSDIKDDFEISHNGSFLKKWFLCFPDESKVVGLYTNLNDGAENGVNLSHIATSHKVFVDDTALISSSHEEMFEELAAYMKTAENRFIVPLVVIETLQARLLSFEDGEASNSKQALNYLANLQRQGLVEIRGEKNDVNICNTLVSVFARFKAFNRIALITQDEQLAKTVLLLNNDHLGGFNVLALRFNGKTLIPWNIDTLEARNEDQCDSTFSSWDTLE